MAGASAASLVADAYWRALQIYSRGGCRHFSGLQAASRRLRSRLTARTFRRLRALDDAFAITGHISDHMINDFLGELERELQAGQQSVDEDGVDDNSTGSESSGGAQFGKGSGEREGLNTRGSDKVIVDADCVDDDTAGTESSSDARFVTGSGEPDGLNIRGLDTNTVDAHYIDDDRTGSESSGGAQNVEGSGGREGLYIRGLSNGTVNGTVTVDYVDHNTTGQGDAKGEFKLENIAHETCGDRQRNTQSVCDGFEVQRGLFAQDGLFLHGEAWQANFDEGGMDDEDEGEDVTSLMRIRNDCMKVCGLLFDAL